jgi:hypothetical protein
LHCGGDVIASEAKQSHEIATSSRPIGTPRNDQLWFVEVNYFMFPLIIENAKSECQRVDPLNVNPLHLL